MKYNLTILDQSLFIKRYLLIYSSFDSENDATPHCPTLDGTGAGVHHFAAASSLGRPRPRNGFTPCRCGNGTLLGCVWDGAGRHAHMGTRAQGHVLTQLTAWIRLAGCITGILESAEELLYDWFMIPGGF